MHLSLASDVGSCGRLRLMVSAPRTTVAYQLESIPHLSVASHSVVEFSPSLHRLAIATVTNVHRGDDRSVGHMTTWLCCRFVNVLRVRLTRPQG